MAARRRQQARLKMQTRADSVPDLTRAEETYNRYMSERLGLRNHMLESDGKVYHGDGVQPRPAHVQTVIDMIRNGCPTIDEWEYAAGQRPNRPTYPDGAAPVIAHPKFKDYIHSKIEPLYTPTLEMPGARTFESQISPFTHKWRGICIVYDAEKSKRDQSHVDPPRNVNYAPHLIFESRFESGNLRQARRVGQFEYELVLKTDVFTKRHTQWYYFRVRNMLPGIIYKFRIVNLLKRDSLYNQGMRPLLYSERNAEENAVGWVRHGHHITYGRNLQHTVCPLLSRELPYYELEWQMEFPFENDTCYLAHCYPYTYSDLKEDLDHLITDTFRSRYAKREIMCETKAGNSCHLLTITDFDCRAKKQYVVVSARVHPGESNSSWMMKGLVNFLTGDTKEAAEIRRKFVYKIVPMLNPDGVIVGNYRCSLQARDLNRNYRHPRRDNFPTVFNIKRLVENINNSVGVFVYCDFHGHSRKSNVFMYGNNPSTTDAGNVRAFLEERMLPFCISRVGGSIFHFESCKFHIRRCKESTGRVVMYRNFNIKNSFTMEATFSGTQLDRDGSRHYNQKDFMNAGKYFALGVMEYASQQADKEKETTMLLDLTKAVTQQILTDSHLTTLDQAAVDIEAVLSSHLNPDKSKQSAQDIASSDIGSSTNISQSDSQSDSADSKRAAVIQALDSITEETLSKCVNILAKLSLPAREAQVSESSDSDSESEPEVPEEKSRKKKKAKTKKKKDKKQVKSSIPSLHDKKEGAISATVKQINRPAADNSALSIQSAQLPLIGNLQDSDYKNANRMDMRSSKGHWSNPYSGRSNGGIPCFSEERSMERAAKRMAELQKRMDEKTASVQTLGPFSEREYFDKDCDIFYDDLALQHRQAEDEITRTIRSHNPHTNVNAKNHMDFLKPEAEEPQFKNSSLTPNTNQFDSKLRRSRTEMFDSRKYSRWQNSADRSPVMETWSEANEHSKIYNSRTDLSRISGSNSTSRFPAATTDSVITTQTASLFDKSNPLSALTREYSEILANKIKASHSRAASKVHGNRSHLLKVLQVNPLHCQPGLE
ncbi:cytosolic carboxypeptidase 2-like isoform X2 [Watersipora subatra]|uniref:cytosolic carboxypeptidase 2-like isoform X2 n=1 Tax=Watersipora subatra TaxID=2589382 RepID=UPI00355C84EE